MAAPTIGSVLGAWRLTAPLGSGGMGQVWRAFHRDSDTPAAVKTLADAGPASRRALRREVDALQRLVHPGIPRVLDHAVDGPVPWLAMELVEGLPFDAWRGASRATSATWSGEDPPAVPPSEESGGPTQDRDAALAVLGVVARTLAWIHGEGVVHRDVKPANVVVRADGQPVLVDFGLRVRRQGRERLDPHAFAGTPTCMAPEQVRGEPLDGRTDLYALGCMLYEVLAGRAPFEGPAAHVLHAHLVEVPAPLVDVPGALAELVRALLEKRPGDRPSFAGEVADALGAPEHGPPPRIHLLPATLRARDAERASLRADRGLTWVVGPAGVGKTRLAADVARAARHEGTRVLVAAAGDEGGTAAALLRALAERTDLGELAPLLARIEPSLGAAAPAVRGERVRQQAALCEALERAAGAGVILCVLDDLQDADDVTLSFVEAAGRRTWSADVRLVALARDDAPPRVLGAAEDAGVLHLGPLPPAELHAVAADALGLPVLPPALTALVERAVTPADLVERLHALVEAGGLVRQRSRWTVTAATGRVPVGRDELLRWRVGGLAPPARAVAEALAVLGATATHETLQALVGAEAGAGLAELHRLHLLDPDALRLPGPAHRDAVLAGMPERRAALSAAAARAVPDAPAATRLQWWLAAGERAEAREAGLRALADARRRASMLEVERTLAVLAGLADDEQERVALELERARTLGRLQLRAQGRAIVEGLEGRCDPVEWVLAFAVCAPPSEAIPRLRLALAGATDPHIRRQLHQELSEAAAEAGLLDDALADVEAALALAGPEDQARLTGRMAWLRMELGHPELAERLLRVALASIPDDAPERAEVLAGLGGVLATLRRTAEARDALSAALATFRATGQRDREAVVLGNLSADGVAESPAHAVPLLRRAVAIQEQLGARGALAYALGNLAIALRQSGRPEEGTEPLARAISLARRVGNPVALGRLLAQAANHHGVVGAYDAAEASADEAVGLLEAAGDGLWLPYALAARGLAELAHGRSAAPWLARARVAAGSEPVLLGDIASLERAQAEFDAAARPA